MYIVLELMKRRIEIFVGVYTIDGRVSQVMEILLQLIILINSTVNRAVYFITQKVCNMKAK